MCSQAVDITAAVTSSGKRNLKFQFENIGINMEVLVIEEIPAEFDARYGKVPRRIFVRNSYSDLYEIMTAEMLRSEVIRPAALFTGVPGIGKSMFMIYFLCKYVNDERFLDKRFAFQVDSDLFHYYVPTLIDHEYHCYPDVASKNVPISDVLVVADILNNEQPQKRAKWTLIFSSPNPLRYKEFLKASPKYKFTIPTWSEDELSMANPEKHLWFERFCKCGGVARTVLWNGIGDDPLNDLDTALTEKGPIVAEYFFKHGFGSVDPEKSYALLHINPPYSQSEGRILYNAFRPDHSFASDCVFQQLQSCFTKGLIAEAAGWFNAGGGLASQKLGAVSAGHLFEKICLWLVPLSCRAVVGALCLSSANSSWDSITLPSIRTLEYNWKQHGNLTHGVLYQPQISNLESGDAFCVLQLQQSTYTLIVVQVTVAEHHPIKANGLGDILNAFPLLPQISRKLILFVTPVDGRLHSAQPLHTKENRVMSVVPVDVQDFEQWVYRYKI